MPLLKLILSILVLSLGHKVLNDVVVEGWSFFQVSAFRFFFAFILSLLLFKNIKIKQGLGLSVFFILCAVLLYSTFLKNSAQSMSILYCFPIQVLLYKYFENQDETDWTLIFIFIQTFMGMVVINRMSFSFIIIEDVGLSVLSSFFMSCYYIWIEKDSVDEHALPGFFLGVMIASLIGILLAGESLIPDVVSTMSVTKLLLISVFATVWVFKVFHNSIKLLGSEFTSIFYFYLPMFHFWFYVLDSNALGLDIPDYLGAIVLLFGPILYLVTVNSEKRALALGVKLD